MWGHQFGRNRYEIYHFRACGDGQSDTMCGNDGAGGNSLNASLQIFLIPSTRDRWPKDHRDKNAQEQPTDGAIRIATAGVL